MLKMITVMKRMMRKTTGNIKLLLTVGSKGIVCEYGKAFQVDSNNGIVKHTLIDIPKDSNFIVTGFNIYSSKINVILNRPNYIGKYVELDHDFIINNCNIIQEDSFKTPESLLIDHKEINIIDITVLKNIVFYILIFLIGFLTHIK